MGAPFTIAQLKALKMVNKWDESAWNKQSFEEFLNTQSKKKSLEKIQE